MSGVHYDLRGREDWDDPHRMDDIVVEGTTLHMEQMDRRWWWMACGVGDGEIVFDIRYDPKLREIVVRVRANTSGGDTYLQSGRWRLPIEERLRAQGHYETAEVFARLRAEGRYPL